MDSYSRLPETGRTAARFASRSTTRMVQNVALAFAVTGVLAMIVVVPVLYSTEASPSFGSVRISGLLQLVTGNLTLQNMNTSNIYYDNTFRRNHTLTTSAHAAATKAIQGIVLHDSLDFPANIATYTRTEQEE
jgi:hypothetical protein